LLKAFNTLLTQHPAFISLFHIHEMLPPYPVVLRHMLWLQQVQKVILVIHVCRMQARTWARANGLWFGDASSRLDVSTVAMNASYFQAADTLSNSLLSQWVQWSLDTHKAADKADPNSQASYGSLENFVLTSLAVLLVLVFALRWCRRRQALRRATQ
jgi:hypothetical protein